MKILLHVNYCEGPGKLPLLFKIAKINGCDGVELRRKYAFADMTQDEYQTCVGGLKSQYPELEITFGGGINFCRGEEDTAKREIEDYSKFIDWAKLSCGTKVLNFFTGTLIARDNDYLNFETNGSAIATAEDYERCAIGLRTIGDIAAASNMLVALETHNCYLHDLVESCRKLMDMTVHDSIGINYDHGNICINRRSKSEIADVFNILGNKIYYAHLKNLLFYKGIFMSTRLEEGDINNLEIMIGLKQNLKSGMLAIEYPCTGDGIMAAKRDMDYIRFMINFLEQNEFLP